MGFEQKTQLDSANWRYFPRCSEKSAEQRPPSLSRFHVGTRYFPRFEAGEGKMGGEGRGSSLRSQWQGHHHQGPHVRAQAGNSELTELETELLVSQLQLVGGLTKLITLGADGPVTDGFNLRANETRSWEHDHSEVLTGAFGASHNLVHFIT